MYIIFSSMSRENENTKVANYTGSFTFGLVGVMLTYDHRLFETLEKEMEVYMPFLLEHEYFNEKDVRIDFFNFMQSIRDLSELTKEYTDKELKLIFKKLSKKRIKMLGKELNHA